MVRLSLTLLGNIGVSLDTQPITQFRTNKAQALLIYLVVEKPAVHYRDALMEFLWPGLPQKSAQTNLRQILYQLNHLIPQAELAGQREGKTAVSLLMTDRKTVKLNPDFPIISDLNHFLSLLDDSYRHHDLEKNLLTCDACRQRLEEAVQLYRGDFLTDFVLYDSSSFETWAQVKREALRRQVLEALDTLIKIYWAANDYSAAETAVRQQLHIDDLRESSYCQLMKILAVTDRRSDAIAVFEECRQLLSTELGMVPSAKTTALSQQIKEGGLNSLLPIRQGIRGYELEDKIGEGAFGTVHKAHQKGIGRTVAVKIIQAKYANQPRFIRRFEAEAQMIAQLEHPHIVPLYDYWREADGAFLVMRWLRGGSLRTALENGAFSVETAVTTIIQIATALHTAHRHGIVHRDVKPGNILLDEEKNAYLSDFGIARDTNANLVNTDANALIGSPAYMSPEQLLGETITTATDIYSLGLVLYTTVTGESPYSTSSIVELMTKQINEPLPLIRLTRPDLPPKMDDIIQKATAKKPDERYENILLFAEDLQKIMSFVNGQIIDQTQPLITIAQTEVVNPYKGLQAFQEQDAVNFYGRKALVEQLISRFSDTPLAELSQGEHRFLAVVGPSGSGKSSVVKAGLIPALRQGAVSGSENWFMVEMTPGNYPLEELESALWRVAVDPPPSLLEPLQKDERGLVRVLKRLLPQDKNKENPSQLLLLIDQFEELFTLVQDVDERTHFLNNLITALTDFNSRLWIVITLRADFYDRPLQFPKLGKLLRSRTELVLPLSPDELKQTIIKPIKPLGITAQPELVLTILNDVNEQAGALPLMQYALTELFERRNDHELTVDTYREIGGVTGALTRRANEIYSNLDSASQEVTRQLFLRLVTLGEGSKDTRRRVLRSELINIDTKLNAKNHDLQTNERIMDTVLAVYGRYRLLTFDYDPITREPTVEVAHEAILHQWDRLRNWLDESRADVRLQRMLTAATDEWRDNNHDQGFLLRGSRLDLFIEWAASTKVAMTLDEQGLLDTSFQARQQRLEKEKERQRREQETIKQLRIAYSLSLAANAREAMKDKDWSKALKLALQASKIGDPPKEVQKTLMDAAFAPGPKQKIVLKDPNDDSPQSIYGLAISPDGETALLGLLDGTLVLLNLGTLTEVRRFATREGQDAILSVAYSKDGLTALSGSADGEVILWNIETGEEMQRFIGPNAVINSIAFSPDDTLIAASGGYPGSDACVAGPVTIWDRSTGQICQQMDVEGRAIDVVFTLDGQKLFVAIERPQFMAGNQDEDKVILLLWNVETGEIVWDFEDARSHYSLALLPDGQTAISTSADNNIYFWDLESGEKLDTFEEHEGNVGKIAVSTSGHLAFSSDWVRGLILWNLKSREIIAQFDVLNISGVAICPNEKTAVSVSTKGEVVIWDICYADEINRFAHPAPVVSVAFHANEQMFFSGTGNFWGNSTGDNTLRLWDLKTGEIIRTYEGHTHAINDIDISPAGDLVLTGSNDESLILWDIKSGAIVRKFIGHKGSVFFCYLPS